MREGIMIRTALAALLAMAFTTAASAAPDKGPAPDAPYRFVGYSSNAPSDLVTGGVGLPALYAACQDPVTGFGPAARMCTTEEFLRSPNIEGTPTVSLAAWIYPTIIGFTTDSGADFSAALDYSGLAVRVGEAGPADAWTCRGWSGSGISGLDVDEKGVIRAQSCGVARMVTCCAPAQ
jgi:hypothetical protein